MTWERSLKGIVKQVCLSQERALGWLQTLSRDVGHPVGLEGRREALGGWVKGTARIGRARGWESRPGWSRASLGSHADSDTVTEPGSHLAT